MKTPPMKTVFVIRNHHGQFLGKQGQWLDDSEPAAAWRSPHRDVALNHLVETNARDIEQRLLLLQCPLNQKDIPLLGDAVPPGKATPVTYDEQEGGTAPADLADSGEDAEDLLAGEPASTATIAGETVE